MRKTARNRRDCRRAFPKAPLAVATRDGFTLSAEFGKQSGGVVQVHLTVRAPDDSSVDLECAEFFLHQTFDPDVIPAVFHDGIAKLNLLAWGGFTVGAWIPCKGVELELDLSQLPNAPRVIREN